VRAWETVRAKLTIGHTHELRPVVKLASAHVPFSEEAWVDGTVVIIEEAEEFVAKL
jgi:hypothetical protein